MGCRLGGAGGREGGRDVVREGEAKGEKFCVVRLERCGGVAGVGGGTASLRAFEEMTTALAHCTNEQVVL